MANIDKIRIAIEKTEDLADHLAGFSYQYEKLRDLDFHTRAIHKALLSLLKRYERAIVEISQHPEGSRMEEYR